jgi:hypothetical protein
VRPVLGLQRGRSMLPGADLSLPGASAREILGVQGQEMIARRSHLVPPLMLLLAIGCGSSSSGGGSGAGGIVGTGGKIDDASGGVPVGGTGGSGNSSSGGTASLGAGGAMPDSGGSGGTGGTNTPTAGTSGTGGRSDAGVPGTGYRCFEAADGCVCSDPPGPNYTLSTSICAGFPCCYAQDADGYSYCLCMSDPGTGCPSSSTQRRVAACPP